MPCPTDVPVNLSICRIDQDDSLANICNNVRNFITSVDSQVDNIRAVLEQTYNELRRIRDHVANYIENRRELWYNCIENGCNNQGNMRFVAPNTGQCICIVTEELRAFVWSGRLNDEFYTRLGNYLEKLFLLAAGARYVACNLETKLYQTFEELGMVDCQLSNQLNALKGKASAIASLFEYIFTEFNIQDGIQAALAPCCSPGS